MSIFLTCILWIFLCQSLFWLIQKNQSLQLSKSVEVQFRDELKTSNFLYLSRIVSDLTNNNSLKCATLDLLENNYYRQIINLSFSNDCQNSMNIYLGLDGENIEQKLTALNGDIYYFKYRSVNSELFYFSIWLFRFFGILLILLVALMLRIQAESERKISIARIDLARQVSHDIRSPLSALNLSLNFLQNLDEEQRALIENSISRINQISNELLINSKFEDKVIPLVKFDSEVNVIEILLNIVKEKKVEYSSFQEFNLILDIKSDNKIKIAIEAVVFQRIISNFINNSFESLTAGSGDVIVSLRDYADTAEVTIADSGCGIPDNILCQFGSNYVTSKDNGNGLGVYHAKREIEKFNGKMSITSKVGIGTMVKIILPKINSHDSNPT